ncbi:D-alanyl-D-alanine carboxypeptidase/D-alanyl-D-alanine-endopeptidase [Bacillus pinisoli]|uniref:D-alanyl-D-alanine carboxypeptidase/D-alanyl-D-alanine endopeptidase n=1 Tax=Bacillus pinisoli TaxID=2901866 RepID=UPI001FF43D7A|nr:D-alanyl-D-alanine carboxypeptidase/D-alanyl-D-alanine-endopeptidase [Bacillus pinisoli]
MFKNILVLFIVISSLVFGVPQSILASEEQQTLNQKIDQLLLTDSSILGGIVGVSIRDSATGKILYEHNGSTRLRPASNLKLITAASALSVLGKDHTFDTEMLMDGTINQGILKGNLYFKGKGDPTLLTSDLEQMVADLKEKELTEIQGNLIGDDSWFDEVRLSVDLPWSDETTYYGAQISAINLSPNDDYDAGTVIVEVKPSLKAGEPPTVSIKPSSSYLKLENRASTGKDDVENTLEVSRKHGENTIMIEGVIPKNGVRVKEWISVWEPSHYVIHHLNELLKAQGIILKGNILLGETPENASLLLSHSSMTLSELLIPFLKFSNNGHGEVLIKEMARVQKGEGSWEKGIEVVKEQIKKWGIDPSKVVLRDGSGISHVNLVSANDLTSLLHGIQNELWYDDFLQALPLAGTSDRLLAGTLLHRMNTVQHEAVVRAKTGTLTSVSSLSGYVHIDEERQYVFSIILNNLVDEDKGKQLEDRFIEILVNQS